ncbi:MAG: metal-sensitive transcriptional regulator [Pelosinus sp.]|nr:metal-sensitive transcriptional regulator [Pelosinus sp.]
MQNTEVKAEVLCRLKTVKGHIAGIERMVEEEQTCNNVMIQLAAVRASVEKIGIYILENSAVECLCSDTIHSPEDKEKVEKIVKQMLAFLK